MKQLNKLSLLLTFLSFPFGGCTQQQVADSDYFPQFEEPIFEKGKGPLLLMDAGHNNFHTLEGKFAPFGYIAAMNGFEVRSITGTITNAVFEDAKILVIANALNEKNVDNWKQPVWPAFTTRETETIKQWVYQGGSLFLIADHMPFAGAVAELAMSMGFTLYDGFAYCNPNQKFDLFSFKNGMLNYNELTQDVDSIVSFTGHAFNIPDSAVSMITFDSAYKVLMPEVAWQFDKDMKMLPAGGMSQLAYSKYGTGKIVVAGEAAMFTAQKAGDIKFGLNAPFAPYNLELLLNILKWLGR